MISVVMIHIYHCIYDIAFWTCECLPVRFSLCHIVELPRGETAFDVAVDICELKPTKCLKGPGIKVSPKLSFVMGFDVANSAKQIFYKQASKLSDEQHKYKIVEKLYKVRPLMTY
jgi:hypothetical protein